MSSWSKLGLAILAGGLSYGIGELVFRSAPVTADENACVFQVYDLSYERHMREIKEFFAKIPNLHHLGRNAQFAHQDVDEIYAGAKKVVGDILTRAG